MKATRKNATHFVSDNGATVFVKEASFFIAQGGAIEGWGKYWTPVIATTLGDARRQGAKLFGVKLSRLYWDEK